MTSLPVATAFLFRLTKHKAPHPTTAVTASLHSPCPAALTAAARNQYRVPLVRPSTNALALVDIPVRVQDAPSQRDFITQPRVASNELPWVHSNQNSPKP